MSKEHTSYSSKNGRLTGKQKTTRYGDGSSKTTNYGVRSRSIWGVDFKPTSTTRRDKKGNSRTTTY